MPAQVAIHGAPRLNECAQGAYVHERAFRGREPLPHRPRRIGQGVNLRRNPAHQMETALGLGEQSHVKGANRGNVLLDGRDIPAAARRHVLTKRVPVVRV